MKPALRIGIVGNWAFSFLFCAAGLAGSLTSFGFWRWVFERLGNVPGSIGLASCQILF
jgi:hypothetical protein